MRAVLAICLAGLLFAAPNALAATTTVTPTADARVEAAHSSTNYGTSSKLYVDNSPLIRSYLSFVVPDVAGSVVTRATLRLYATSSSSAGWRAHSTASGWTESKITYANAPALVSNLGSSGSVASNRWTQADVTAAVTGPGQYSFAVDTSSSTKLALNARESGSNRPQLVLETVASPLPAPSNLQVSERSRSDLSVVWDAAPPDARIVGYHVYVDGAAAVSTAALTYTASGLDCGSSHQIGVAAYDATGAESSRISISPDTVVCPASLSFPIRATFYYPWFAEAWDQQGYSCGSSPASGLPATPSGCFTWYSPSAGYYSLDGTSGDDKISADVQALDYGHQEAGLASWWGQGTRTDQRFPRLLRDTDAAGSPLRWALYYEPEGDDSGNEISTDRVRSDLAYIKEHYINDDAYLWVGGKPVIFVYNANDNDCSVVNKWNAANKGYNFHLVLKVFVGYRNCTDSPDGWHQYAPANAEDYQQTYSFTISPGFWKAGEATPRLERDLSRWNTNIQDQLAADVHWQLTTTYNEWGEGTSIESAAEWETPSGYGAYLDALHLDGQSATAPPTSP